LDVSHLRRAVSAGVHINMGELNREALEIWSHPAQTSAYSALGWKLKRFEGSSKSVDLGFTAYEYEGINWVEDVDCDKDRLDFIDFSTMAKYVAKDYEGAVQSIKAGAVDLIYDNPMEVLGACVRGALIAPGRKLVVADLSNIEGRGLAWAAGETWKLEAFRAFDAGEGEDLYKLAYARAFRVPVETVGDAERQIGKVMELALGYAGGAGAFATFAAAYSIDLDALADIVVLPKQIEAETLRAWAWAESTDRTYGMSEKVWRTCDGLKRLWRHAHPETVAWWGEMENAARQAIYNPGEVVPCRKVSFGFTKGWLRMVLPSGRSLCYPGPQVADDGTISYMGVHQFSRKWCRLKTYSGKLVENAIQGIARDVMAHNMPLIEDAGYEILLTVHDEVITETEDNESFSAKGLSGLLAATPDWADGFPLAAAGYEAYR
jgi:DNA polymerase